MWTPRRIVLLAFGCALFVLAYTGYTSVLGGINGLPPLPPEYLDVGDPSVPPPPRASRIEEKLQQAFGPNCEELKRPIRLDLVSKNMVLATDQFEIVPDDASRVHLIQVSLALFGKNKGDGRPPEINTIRADEAYLQLDHKIEKQFDLGKSKIIGAELRNRILLVNNRRTPGRDDDLEVVIKHGPLFYEESTHRVHTPDVVDLTDRQSKPKPITIQGKGLEMELASDSEPAKPNVAPPARRARGETVSGVKRIDLLRDVSMTLYSAADSGFLGGQKKPAARPAVQPNRPAPAVAAAAGPLAAAVPFAPEKGAVRIHTPGRFRYELFKDHDLATFDIPAADPGRQPGSPEDVTVARELRPMRKEDAGGDPPQDTLTCKHLVLRLHRREGADPVAPGDRPSSDQALEIETAHATAPDNSVALSSDSQGLIAYGDDFLYERPLRRTTLKGSPQMDATDKDGNRIRAREMQIQEVHAPTDPPDAPGHQQVTASGPGTVDLCSKEDKGDEKPKTLMRASWNDRLVSTRDGPHDLLTLTGGAAFEDYEHQQTLRADTLKVWLNPHEGDEAGKPEAPGTVSPQRARRPHHLEAVRNVQARSAEMVIHDTSRLVVRFKDVPDAPALTATGKPAAATGPAGGTAPAGPAAADKSSPGKPEEPARPIDLSARSVEAWVLRSAARNVLERLETEGSVQVHQAPAKPDEKGVDIEGDTLQMTAHPEGNYLVVAADGAGGGLAQVNMDRTHIFGTEVNINQRTNEAWVPGGGSMLMESRTDFQGRPLDHAEPLEVYWTKSMYFNGRFAEFFGGEKGNVQAKQGEARLTCKERLVVNFDRAVSLKEGNKGEQAAKVQSLQCSQDVQVEERVFEKQKLVKFQRVRGTEMVMKVREPDEDAPKTNPPANPGNEVHTSGPGHVRLLQAGGADPLAAPEGAPGSGPKPAPGGAKPRPPDGMKMTFVSFEKMMYANNHTNFAMFLGNVRVLNFPCEDPNREIDLDVLRPNLPEGALYLECQRLDVQSRPANGRSNQEMWARNRVKIRSREFWGQADLVTFNEAKDQIILEGGPDGLALLVKTPPNKAKPQEFSGKKIIYIRSTGAFKVDGGNWFTGQN